MTGLAVGVTADGIGMTAPLDLRAKLNDTDLIKFPNVSIEVYASFMIVFMLLTNDLSMFIIIQLKQLNYIRYFIY